MAADTRGPILIGFDGSDSAKAAVTEAGRLFGSRRALVLTVWRSVAGAASVGVIGMPANVAHAAVERVDEGAADQARSLAAEGADLAARAGLEASPLTRSADRSEWSEIVRTARDEGAEAVVVGSRGRSGIGAAVLGSVSAGVLNHSGRPVLVVHARDHGDRS